MSENNKGTEIFGKVTIDGILFEVGYRSGFDLRHQGSFDKCLRIYEGLDSNNKVISGHQYFNDDKFQVTNANIYVDDMVLILAFPLLKAEERYKIGSITKSKTLFISRIK